MKLTLHDSDIEIIKREAGEYRPEVISAVDAMVGRGRVIEVSYVECEALDYEIKTVGYFLLTSVASGNVKLSSILRNFVHQLTSGR